MFFFFSSLISGSIFPCRDLKSIKGVIGHDQKPTSYEVNHNIANFNLEKKKYLKTSQKNEFYTIVYFIALIRTFKLNMNSLLEYTVP